MRYEIHNTSDFTRVYPQERISTNSYVRIYKLFMQNKPNFRNDKMSITIDMTSEYENFPAGSGQKTNPKQTQFNPKQTQFDERPKLMQSIYLQSVMMTKPHCGFVKTKPIKANNQSSLIINHLEGKANSNPISSVSPVLQFIEKLHEKMLQIFNNLLISPPFLIDNSIDYALYGVSRHIYQSKIWRR